MGHPELTPVFLFRGYFHRGSLARNLDDGRFRAFVAADWKCNSFRLARGLCIIWFLDFSEFFRVI